MISIHRVVNFIYPMYREFDKTYIAYTMSGSNSLY